MQADLERADLDVVLAGQRMALLGDRALWWPDRDAVLLSDLHLGKADIFRRAGIALPHGGTAADLLRLGGIVARTGCTQLWILGDVLHGPAHRAAWYRQWLAWREHHAALQVHVVAGNHDRALPHAALGVHIHAEAVDLDGIVLRHEPAACEGRHVIAGHLHPQAALRGMTRRWPAFWLRDGITVLPAFSGFTAGVVPRLGPGERLVACVEGAAIALG